MTVAQDRMRNPFGMDEACPACAELVDARSRIVHGYGDVGAEFLFVAERPTAPADETGVPVDPDGTDPLAELLVRLGFLHPDERDADDNPVLTNAFITHLTRCRHPDRSPTDAEIANCEAFLSAEVRTINPEIMVPIGDRALTVLVEEHTTMDSAELSAASEHGTTLRGRGFELLPMVGRDELSPDRIDSFVDAMDGLMGQDYRQTKGRQGR